MIEPGTRIGGLLIEDLLGRGAMGEVYRAVQVSLKRPVAVKRIAGHLVDNPDMVARFEREAQCIARIQHTNVVAIYEFGQYPDANGAQHYLLVMELVEGGRSLKSFQHGAMDWKLASSVMLQAAAGLAAAAEQGVVHRDIKPDNIMITKKGIAKLTDFGLAKAVDSSAMTMGGTLMGTPAYMPPEACRGEATDHRGDIYSLGATWYHLLSGHVPFRSDNTMAMLRAHVDEPAPNILALFPTVPEPIADLVRRCMAKKPEDRPQSAQQLANELMALVAQGIYLKQAVPELVDAPHAPAGDPSTIATMVAGGPSATAVTKVVSPAGASAGPGQNQAAPGPVRAAMPAPSPTAATINVPSAQAGGHTKRISPMVFLIPIIVIGVVAALIVWGMSGKPDHATGGSPTTTSTTSSGAPAPTAPPVAPPQAPAHEPVDAPTPVVAVAPAPSALPLTPPPSSPGVPPTVVAAPGPPNVPATVAIAPAPPTAPPAPPPIPAAPQSIAPPPSAPTAHTDAPAAPVQPAPPPIPPAVASLPPLPPPPILKQPEVVKPTREAAVADTATTEFRAALRNKRALRAEAYLSSIPADAGGFKDMVKNLTTLKAAQDAAFASMSRAAFSGHAAELADAATQAAIYPELAQSVGQSRLYVATIEERWKAALNRADEAISHHDTASASALLAEVPADPLVLTAPFTAKRAATAAALSGSGH